jgi:hypothetical protein
MDRSDIVLIWVARLGWLALAATGSTYSSALDGAQQSVRVVTAICLFAGWAAVLLALLVPSTVSLTVVRLLSPLAPVTAAVALAAGAESPAAIVTIALGLTAAFAVSTAEVGIGFVQASAYGAERRLPLRPPGPLVPVIVVLWLAVAALVIAGPLLLADGRVVIGIATCALAVAGAALLGTRCHHLSKRWLVVVPAGLVVHDRFVLADTFMVSRPRVQSLQLAPATTEAADATGNALGSAVEITLTEMETLVLAPDRAHPGGRALHVRSLLISPTRPGRALRAWLDP